MYPVNGTELVVPNEGAPLQTQANPPVKTSTGTVVSYSHRSRILVYDQFNSDRGIAHHGQ